MYYQVAQQLEQAIESGELPPGSRLDGELALADQLGVSRPTLRRAIEYLVDRGYLVRRRAVGTQVVHPKVRRPVELTSLYDDLTASRKNPRTKVLSIDKVPATDAVAHALGLEDGEDVLALERLRYADGQPLAIMRNWLPLGLVELDADAEVVGLVAVGQGVACAGAEGGAVLGTRVHEPKGGVSCLAPLAPVVDIPL
jgi:GntR family transcriptional regulator